MVPPLDECQVMLPSSSKQEWEKNTNHLLRRAWNTSLWWLQACDGLHQISLIQNQRAWWSQKRSSLPILWTWDWYSPFSACQLIYFVPVSVHCVFLIKNYLDKRFCLFYCLFTQVSIPHMLKITDYVVCWIKMACPCYLCLFTLCRMTFMMDHCAVVIFHLHSTSSLHIHSLNTKHDFNTDITVASQRQYPIQCLHAACHPSRTPFCSTSTQMIERCEVPAPDDSAGFTDTL